MNFFLTAPLSIFCWYLLDKIFFQKGLKVSLILLFCRGLLHHLLLKAEEKDAESLSPNWSKLLSICSNNTDLLLNRG